MLEFNCSLNGFQVGVWTSESLVRSEVWVDVLMLEIFWRTAAFLWINKWMSNCSNLSIWNRHHCCTAARWHSKASISAAEVLFYFTFFFFFSDAFVIELCSRNLGLLAGTASSWKGFYTFWNRWKCCKYTSCVRTLRCVQLFLEGLYVLPGWAT